MSVISIETAMQHLRADEADSALVQAYLDAAEDSAAQFMGRYFYADELTLVAAKQALTARRAIVREAYHLAIEAADDLSDESERQAARQRACDDLDAALYEMEKVSDAVVVNPSITAACLLITGHLYAQREDVVVGTIATAVPLGSRALLHQYRIGLGV